MATFIEVTMATGNQEQHLRVNLGLILVWTVMGCLLAALLYAASSAAGFGSGFMLGKSTEVAATIAAYVIVGSIVLAGIVKAFLDPLPAESSDEIAIRPAEGKPPHLVTRHSIRRHEAKRVEQHDDAPVVGS